MPTLSDALHELYSGDPARFVERRTALVADARAAGDRALATQIGALRKPTVAAAAVNRLDGDALDELLALGEELRAAQQRLDSDAMKDATARRQRLLHDIVTRLELSGQVGEDVRSTLLAATADRAAADAVASRALVRALSYSGWGEVDLGDVLAHATARPSPSERPALRLVSGGAKAAGDASGERTTSTERAAGRDPSEESTRDDPRAAPGTTETREDTATQDGQDGQDGTDTQDGTATQENTEDGTPRPAAEEWRVAREAAAAAAARAEEARRKAAAEAQAEVTRLETRVRGAQAAVDAASAARDSAQAALDAARGRLAALEQGD